MPGSRVRCQAAIVRDHHVLLLRVVDHIGSGRMFWLLPGGGMEANETEEACVQQEVFEETHLRVEVERLLFTAPDAPGSSYQQRRTYLCRAPTGEASPGLEPEIDTPDLRTIQEVGWFDLRAPTRWDALVTDDPITFPQLQQARVALGYRSNEMDLA